jgi:succinoglycan biosynthesis protein ExoO
MPSARRVAIITRHTPLPWDDGAGSYLHDVAAFLASRGHRVDVLWLEPHEPIRWQRLWRLPAAFSPNVRLHLPGAWRCGRRYVFPRVIWLPLKARALHRLRRLLEALHLLRPRSRPGPTATGEPGSGRPWMSAPSPAELALTARWLSDRRPDVVIASYAWLAPMLELPAARSARRLCLTHDVAWRRAQLSAPAGTPPEVTVTQEAAWLQAADTLVAISPADARDLQALAPRARVIVAPKAFAVGPTAAAPLPPRLLFVGSANAFNVAGLRWFLAEVWPRIRTALPEAALEVCGSIAHAFPAAPAGVVFRGGVPDLAPHYAAAAVVIVPLRQATGLNIKLAEAAAHGRAIVATPVTLEGAPFLRDAVTTADSAPDFAAAVLALLGDGVARAAASARSLAAARRHLSPEACYGPLLESTGAAAPH